MERNKIYQTIIVLVLACLLAYLYFGHIQLLYAAIFLSVCSLLSEKAAHWIHILWQRLGNVLGKISGTILLSLVFFLILTPLALLRKLFQPKQKGVKASSNFIEMNHSFVAKDLNDLW